MKHKQRDKYKVYKRAGSDATTCLRSATDFFATKTNLKIPITLKWHQISIEILGVNIAKREKQSENRYLKNIY